MLNGGVNRKPKLPGEQNVPNPFQRQHRPSSAPAQWVNNSSLFKLRYFHLSPERKWRKHIQVVTLGDFLVNIYSTLYKYIYYTGDRELDMMYVGLDLRCSSSYTVDSSATAKYSY